MTDTETPRAAEVAAVVERLRGHRPYNQFTDGPLVVDALALILAQQSALAASEARATALEGERARDERVAEMAYDAMSAALKLCQVHASELLTENEERQKLRLSIFSTLEMPAVNLGNIARRAKERREAGAKL